MRPDFFNRKSWEGKVGFDLIARQVKVLAGAVIAMETRRQMGSKKLLPLDYGFFVPAAVPSWLRANLRAMTTSVEEWERMDRTMTRATRW